MNYLFFYKNGIVACCLIISGLSAQTSNIYHYTENKFESIPFQYLSKKMETQSSIDTLLLEVSAWGQPLNVGEFRQLNWVKDFIVFSLNGIPAWAEGLRVKLHTNDSDGYLAYFFNDDSISWNNSYALFGDVIFHASIDSVRVHYLKLEKSGQKTSFESIEVQPLLNRKIKGQVLPLTTPQYSAGSVTLLPLSNDDFKYDVRHQHRIPLSPLTQEFSFDYLYPGKYKLLVFPRDMSHTEYVSTFFGGDAVYSEGAVIDVPEDPFVKEDANVNLIRGGLISLSAAPGILEAIIVSSDSKGFVREEWQYESFEVPGDSYIIPAVPPGQYKILVRGKRTSANVWMPGTLDWNEAELIEVSEGETINVSLPELEGQTLDLTEGPNWMSRYAETLFQDTAICFMPAQVSIGGGRDLRLKLTNGRFYGFLPNEPYHLCAHIGPEYHNGVDDYFLFQQNRQFLFLDESCEWSDRIENAKSFIPPESGSEWNVLDICTEFSPPNFTILSVNRPQKPRGIVGKRIFTTPLDLAAVLKEHQILYTLDGKRVDFRGFGQSGAIRVFVVKP